VPEVNSEYRKVMDTLKSADFAGKLKMGELDQLMQNLKKMKCSKGYTIIKQGDPGDAFYMILSGKVSVWKQTGTIFKKNTRLAELGPGEFFGEMALVADAPRNASVIAGSDCELYVLYRQDFKKIMLSNIAIAAALQDTLKERQEDTEKKTK
jgi:CRP-like cAMP-binding protein